MMDRSLILDKISAIAGKYISTEEIEIHTPLTSKPYYIDARSLAAIFMDIEREFGVDLNKVFDQPLDYSVSTIANAVRAQF
jgi:acyl carrier protein